MRHIIGDSREQSSLLPDTLDDHPVRVIDTFVDTLDMKALVIILFIAVANSRSHAAVNMSLSDVTRFGSKPHRHNTACNIFKCVALTS